MTGLAQRLPRDERLVVVGVADIKVTQDPEAVIVTYALGSCIAVCAYDPSRRIAGMIHYMLPLSSTAPDKASRKPAMFADTGVIFLFDRLFELGCRKENIIIKAAGGGRPLGDNSMFNIGERNYTVLKKLLWKNNIMIAAEDVGGQSSRTVRLFAGDGRVIVSTQGQERIL